MTITIPSGQPSHRFMRYVRPPVKEAETLPQLFPSTRIAGPLQGTTESLTRLRALHVDTSHATTLTGHDEEALNQQAATTQPGNVTNRPGKINVPVDRPGPHGWTFGYPSPWS